MIFISFFFKFFISLFYYFAWGDNYIFGNGKSRSYFLRKKKSMGYIFFLGWKIRMGRRLSFKGIYGFGKIGGNLQGRSTRNHHWKVLREGLKMDNTYSPWEKKVIQQHVKEGSPVFWWMNEASFFGKIQGTVGRTSRTWMKEIVSVTWKEDLPF